MYSSATLTLRSTTTDDQISGLNKYSLPWTMNIETYGPFQQETDWAFAYSSTPADQACTSYEIDNIEGRIPDDLRGTFYKVGPGKLERGGERYAHVLDGDGFCMAIDIDGARQTATYKGRFVETEYFQEEESLDQIKYRNVFGTQRPGGPLANAFDLTLKNVANTNIVKWGGRLFCFWEAGRPYELDPDTLETLCGIGIGIGIDIGDNDEDGHDSSILGPLAKLGGLDCKIRGITIDEGGPIDGLAKCGRSFTAHPHIYGDRIIGFRTETNAQTKTLELEFVEFDPDWQELTSQKYSVGTTPPPHDFSVSSNYYAFFENPFGPMDNLPYLLGFKAPTQIMQLTLRDPTKLHIVPRPGYEETSKQTEPMVIDLPTSYFNIHLVGNSNESLDERTGHRLLHLYSTGWDLTDERFFPSNQDSVPFLGAWGGLFPDFTNGIVPPSLLYHTTIDLHDESILSHEEVCPGITTEFPTQEEGHENDHSDIVYCNVASTDYTSLPGTGLVQVDAKAKDYKLWWAEHQIFTHEVIPVRKQQSNGESLDDGSWLLTPLYDAGKKRTTIAILDSTKFEEGPVCRLHLKHHITYGLHGSFAPYDE